MRKIMTWGDVEKEFFTDSEIKEMNRKADLQSAIYKRQGGRKKQGEKAIKLVICSIKRT